jgi:hypothetical protein
MHPTVCVVSHSSEIRRKESERKKKEKKGKEKQRRKTIEKRVKT